LIKKRKLKSKFLVKNDIFSNLIKYKETFLSFWKSGDLLVTEMNNLRTEDYFDFLYG
jgi:hypothetical protein